MGWIHIRMDGRMFPVDIFNTHQAYFFTEFAFLCCILWNMICYYHILSDVRYRNFIALDYIECLYSIEGIFHACCEVRVHIPTIVVINLRLVSLSRFLLILIEILSDNVLTYSCVSVFVTNASDFNLRSYIIFQTYIIFLF